MRSALKHKHLVLDQRKIEAAKRYFGVRSEQEAIDKALSLLVEVTSPPKTTAVEN